MILLIKAVLKKQGRNFDVCELCGKIMGENKAQLHHTKYEGATIYDLKIVCHRCNTQQENKFLK